MFLPGDPAVYLTPLALLTLVASFIQIRKNQADLRRRQKEIDQKIYETLILREIGERIGYELSVAKILETIIASLSKLLPYSVVSFLLVGSKGQLTLRFHLEESVNRQFLDTVKKHMGETLAKIAPEESKMEVSEVITGTIVDEGEHSEVASFWVTPLVINERGVGVLALASKKAGLYTGPEMEFFNKILAQASRAVNNLEKVIALEEEKLNAMVSSMADGVLMLSRELSLVVINPAASLLLGLPSSPKPSIFEIAKVLADKVDLRTKIEESIHEDKLVVFENLVVGDKVSRLLITPVKGASAGLAGTVVLFHDVTAQKELERIREEFTAIVVHELRAPLTVVRGATEMILHNPQLTTEQQGQELVKTMQTSAGNMLSLVNDLLDVAKIEAGKFQVIKTQGNLAEVVHDRVVFFGQLASPKSIRLVEEMADPNLTADFDRERISQVLNNLLSNAIKFTAAGGTITVSAYRVETPEEIKRRFGKPDFRVSEAPAVVVAVSDTGAGIAEDRLPELFSKFKQLRPSDGEHKGTGLGLVIAKGIVESHGGEIFVQSKVNEGTTFYFLLPAA